MAQGKFKKGKLSVDLKKKQKKNHLAFTRRPNAPIQQKKAKFTENEKIKNALSKTVNKTVEKELRSRAAEGNINLSNAQKAVAKHHESTTSNSTSSTFTSTTLPC